MNQFCPSCGAQVNPDDRFCHICGHQLQASTGSADQPTTIIEPPAPTPPPVQPAPPAAPPEPAPGGSSGRNVVVLIVALVAVLAAMGVVAFVVWRGTSGSTTGTTASSSPSSSPTPTPTVTKTERPKPTPTVTVTRTTIPDLPDRGSYDLPAGYKNCDVGVYANSVTSCPFANNVASAWYASGGATYLADVYSPVTGNYYDMYCTDTLPARCSGGNDAVVVIDYVP